MGPHSWMDILCPWRHLARHLGYFPCMSTHREIGERGEDHLFRRQRWRWKRAGSSLQMTTRPPRALSPPPPSVRLSCIIHRTFHARPSSVRPSARPSVRQEVAIQHTLKNWGQFSGLYKESTVQPLEQFVHMTLSIWHSGENWGQPKSVELPPCSLARPTFGIGHEGRFRASSVSLSSHLGKLLAFRPLSRQTHSRPTMEERKKGRPLRFIS